jgi:hypothetical protein
MFLLAAAGVADAAPTRETVVGIELAAALNNADSNAPYAGHGVFVHGGVVYPVGEHAWYELGGIFRFAQFDSPGDTMLDALAGIRAGLETERVRPWLGIYAGLADHVSPDDDDVRVAHRGLALDLAFGVDYELSAAFRGGVRADLASDLAEGPYQPFIWYSAGVGISRVF